MDPAKGGPGKPGLEPGSLAAHIVEGFLAQTHVIPDREPITWRNRECICAGPQCVPVLQGAGFVPATVGTLFSYSQ